MQSRLKHIVFGLPVLLLLVSGCSSMKQETKTTLKVLPTQSITHSVDRAEAFYILGRYHQGSAQHEKAFAAFSEAVRVNPAHARAHNALALMLVSRGQHEQAIEAFEKALASGQDASTVRNNLGYAYLLQGHPDKALAVLEVAAASDPAHLRVRENLTMARDALAAREVSAIAQKPKLEISNGNGVTGMARATVQHLKGEGYDQFRMTNTANFRLEKTEITYRPGFQKEAYRLQALLQPDIPVIEAAGLRADVKVRLSLGKDTARSLQLQRQGERGRA